MFTHVVVLALLSFAQQSMAGARGPSVTQPAQTDNRTRSWNAATDLSATASAVTQLTYEVGTGVVDMYMLTLRFRHNDALPIPTEPATQCDPTVAPPALASDGVPYYAGRAMNFPLSLEVQTVTGFQSVGFDFNPCGHPPVENFGVPHYDIHFYYATDEEREGWTCNMLEGAPVCNPAPGAQNTSATGALFFNLVQGNLPANFTADLGSAVPGMGVHYFDNTSLAPAARWDKPVLVMGGHDARVVFFEPMVPLAFLSSDVASTYGPVEVTYEEQDMIHLPSEYSVATDGAGGHSVVLRGRIPPRIPALVDEFTAQASDVLFSV